MFNDEQLLALRHLYRLCCWRMRCANPEFASHVHMTGGYGGVCAKFDHWRITLLTWVTNKFMGIWLLWLWIKAPVCYMFFLAATPFHYVCTHSFSLRCWWMEGELKIGAYLPWLKNPGCCWLICVFSLNPACQQFQCAMQRPLSTYAFLCEGVWYDYV